MTNEEKADDICAKYGASKLIPTEEECIAYNAAMEMAEWKDQQFKQILQVIYSKTLSIEKDVVIEQIYKKLFGEDLDSNELEKDELKNILEKIKTIEL